MEEVFLAICAETGYDADTAIEDTNLADESLQGMLHGDWKGYLFSGKDGYEQAWPMVLTTLKDMEHVK